MQRAKIVRLVAVLAMMLGVFSMMASPASAQGTVSGGVGLPCQVTDDGVITQAQTVQQCVAAISAALPAGSTLTTDGEGNFNIIGADGESIDQGPCGRNIILPGGNIIQFTCGDGTAPTPTATATPVTPTSVPPTATATSVPPTATATPVTPTATATPDDDDDDTPVTPTATVPGDDDDDDDVTTPPTATTPAGDDDDDDAPAVPGDDDDSDAGAPPVSDLPSTGQGTTQNDSSVMALVLGAASVLLAGVAFVWQRRGSEV